MVSKYSLLPPPGFSSPAHRAICEAIFHGSRPLFLCGFLVTTVSPKYCPNVSDCVTRLSATATDLSKEK